MSVLKYRLRLPGPTPVPTRIATAMAEAIVNHRGPEFHEMMSEVQHGLSVLFGADGPVLLLASSGSGAMEASFVNAIDPADNVLVIANGQWGERFATMTRGIGASVTVVESPWGQPIDLQRVRDAFARKDYRAVLVTHNESSTGAVTNLEPLGAMVAETDTLLIVDAVSSLGGMPIEQKRVGADIVFSASQKALMCPPGLGLVSLSSKAWSALERSSSVPRFYWDFKRARASIEEGETPFTPPINIVAGVREALRMMFEEGLDHVFARHALMANALRAGMGTLGFETFPPREIASSTVAVGRAPEGFDASALVRHVYKAHNTVIAGARNRLRGKVIRLGTMGTIGASDILTDLYLLETSLQELGHEVRREAALEAASRVLSREE